MAKTLQSLAGVGQDPEMALKIFQAMAESTQRSAPTQLPTQPQQHPDQSKLMAPEDLPFIERLFRGEEMPFDVGGTAKQVGGAARTLKKARLTPTEADFFEYLNAAEIAELKKFVPSVRLIGPKDPDLPATALQVAETDLPKMFKYLDDMHFSESRAGGGPGASTLPPTFSRPELLMDRFK